MQRAMWLGFLTLNTLACGGAAATKQYAPLSAPLQLPSRESLTELSARPVPVLTQTVKARGVDRWTFEGEGLGDADIAPPAPVVSALAAAGPTPTPALHCVAEQVARFSLAHAASPSPRVLSYMSARCGTAHVEALRTMMTRFDSAPEGSVEDIAAALPPDTWSALGPVFGDAPRAMRAGAWLQRGDDGTVALAVVSAPTGVSVRALPIEDDVVTVAGRLALEDVTEVMGVVNRGPHGWAECTSKGAAADFTLRCPIDAGDASAWIDVVVAVKGQLLGRTVARVLAHREGAGAITYPTQVERRPVSDPEAFRREVLARLNARRATAGLRPLRLATAQSAQMDPLAPHYFAGDAEGDAAVLDRITLGVMAGWDVKGGLITNAQVLATHVPGSRDAVGWLTEMLDRPTGRRALLAPQATQVALGAAVDAPRPGLSSLVATYTFLDDADVGAEAAEFVTRLNDARAAAGRAPVQVRSDPMPELDEAAARVREGTHPGLALDEALAAAVARRTISMGGMYLVTARMEDAEFSEELITAADLNTWVRVAHVAIGESRWGFRVVLVATTRGPGSARTAQRGPHEGPGVAVGL
ncbi:MAG: hypothetical protein AAGN82_23685 [Myxococcota bacterium]